MTPDEIVQRALAHLGGDADAWNAGMKLEPGSSGALVFRADPPEHLTSAVHAMEDFIGRPGEWTIMNPDQYEATVAKYLAPQGRIDASMNIARLRAENRQLKAESRAHGEHIARLHAELSALAHEKEVAIAAVVAENERLTAKLSAFEAEAEDRSAFRLRQHQRIGRPLP